MMRSPYYYGQDPWVVRPNYGGVLSETDWSDINFATTAEVRKLLCDTHKETASFDPTAPWRTKESP